MKKAAKQSPEEVYSEVDFHYQSWTEDNKIRQTRKNGWDDVTDAYWGKLPADWPYINKVVDPRIRTSLLEKNARLLNAKLRGRLVPREGGDVLKARINNALLDFQWDSANEGGTMLEKWGMMDLDTRNYASKFGLVKWKFEKNDEGEILFNGNEFRPLDIRNCGLDPNCENIRNAKWFQVREWAEVRELESQSDTNMEPKYPGLEELKTKMYEDKQDRRDNAYTTRILQNKGLQDKMGTDPAFPVVEIVTEYRKDRWITFAPKYKVILRDIENPYEHHRIPIVQLKYYSIQGDPLGESEVEPVLPIWRAIQATVCGYLDSQATHVKPPLKILEGSVRIETLIYGPEAQWMMDRPDAVTEMTGSGEALRYFQTTYTSLVSAFNTAMGDFSQGTSNIDPTGGGKKTATEIKASAKQQNVRDQKNQSSLSEALQDMMSMWLSNNKQFLFTDPEQSEYILRIIGSELFNYFKRAGLDEMTLPVESMQAIGDIVQEHGGNMSDDDIQGLVDAGKVPKYPVFDNPKEKNPEKLTYKAKLRVNDMGDGAELSIVPEDLTGNYDYIPSVKSMSAGADSDLSNARQQAFQMVTGNPAVLQMLSTEGVQPKIKEWIIDLLDQMGSPDGERYFEKIQQQPQPPQAQQMSGLPPQQMDQSMMGQPQPQPEQPQIPQPGMPQQ